MKTQIYFILECKINIIHLIILMLKLGMLEIALWEKSKYQPKKKEEQILTNGKKKQDAIKDAKDQIIF